MPCSLLDVKVFDVSVLGIQHVFISCVLVRVCACVWMRSTNLSHGCGIFFFIKFFLIIIIVICIFRDVPVTGK